MVDLESNKKIVREFVDALAALDCERFLSFLSEDVHFETTGYSLASGVRTKAELAKVLLALRSVLPNGIKISILTMTAEEDRVVCELRGQSKTAAGEDYNNHYVYFFQLCDEKIVTCREYMDFILVERLIGPALKMFAASGEAPR